VVLRLRFADFTRATRSHTLPQPTADTEQLLLAARCLLHTALPMLLDRGCTLVGVSLANLDDEDAIQLMLPFDDVAPGALDAAVDGVRDRFGSQAVTRAVLLGRSPGLSVPLLPD
jgi:DNA polymerase-4